MIASRPIKLALIVVICAAFGFFIGKALGGISLGFWLTMIGAPVLIGTILGVVGLAPNGKCRNGKIILSMSLLLLAALTSLIAFGLYDVLYSTDL